MPPPRKKRRTIPSVDRVLARQIKELRRKQGVSQQRLAEMLGETQSTVTRIESGERAITVAELLRIAIALDCAPIYLLSGGLTGDDLPVTPNLTLDTKTAEWWISGWGALAGGDDHAYRFVNVSVTRARELEEAIQRARQSSPRFAELEWTAEDGFSGLESTADNG